MFGLSASLLFAGTACAPAEPSADVRVGVSVVSLRLSKVARVDLTVRGQGIPGDMVFELTGSGDAWTGLIPDIPAGENRTFTARVYDKNDRSIFKSTVRNVLVADGATVSVQFFLHDEADEPKTQINAAPLFDALVVGSDLVSVGGSVQLTAVATDREDRELTYAWSATAGKFNDSTLDQVMWTAPSIEGTHEITATVTDSEGASSSLSFLLLVELYIGNADITAHVNTAPSVLNLTASDGQINKGESVELDLTVIDPEADPLTFAWTTDCHGSFDDASIEDPVFTLRTVPSNRADCTVYVSVQDAPGAVNTASLSLATGPDVCESGGC